MPKSTYLANKILDHIHGGGDFTRPGTTYLALMTVSPTPSGGGTEVTGGSYTRLTVTNNSTNWPAATAAQKTNGIVLSWPTATAGWGTIVAVAEYDASSGGNLLNYGALTNPTTIVSGQTFSTPIGGAVFTES